MPRKAKKVRGIFERPPGSGEWWISYCDSEGQRHREKAGTRGNAIDLLDKRRAERLEGKKFPHNLRAKSVTFGDLADAALKRSKAENGARHTKELENKFKILKRRFGNRGADLISKGEITEWLAERSAEHNWKPGTRNRWQAAFSLAFSVGIDAEKIAKNPASRIRRLTENNGRIRYLLDDEEGKLRAVLEMDCPSFVPWFDIALHTGLRPSEQFSIVWKDVDFKNQLVTVNGKNGDVRHIPLNDVAVSAFCAMKEQAKARSQDKAGATSSATSGTASVFPTVAGKQPYRHWFDPAVKKAKLADLTWYCVRHTFISRLVMAGVDLRTVASLAGHRTIQMTMRYAHLAPDHCKAAVARLLAVKSVQNGTSSGTNRSTTP